MRYPPGDHHFGHIEERVAKLLKPVRIELAVDDRAVGLDEFVAASQEHHLGTFHVDLNEIALRDARLDGVSWFLSSR